MSGSPYIKLTPNTSATAACVLGTNSVTLKANKTNHVVLDETAVHLSGNVALHTQHIKYASLFAFQRPMQAIIPSCIGTPTPMCNVEFPTETLKHLAEGAAEMMVLLGLMGAAQAGSSVL